MPYRVERFNDHGRHPNKLISFIKEERRDRSTAEQAQALSVLNRVAAIVYPIMKANGLQVTTLEEHPYNLGYLGINYNAGECIGLVLRTKYGSWIPENLVLQTMLHELSHCTNMHHKSSFWQTLRNYRAGMQRLQLEGYTGEGFWGKGIVLGTGEDSTTPIDSQDMPKSICGGALNGSRFRRSRGQQNSSMSRTKKVKLGQVLGGDLEVRRKLEGRSTRATPKVANSARGRLLRAAAAEARLSAAAEQRSGIQEVNSMHADVEESDDIEECFPKWKIEDEDEATQDLLRNEMKNEMKVLKQAKLPFKPLEMQYKSKDLNAGKRQQETTMTAEIICISDTEEDSGRCNERQMKRES